MSRHLKLASPQSNCLSNYNFLYMSNLATSNMDLKNFAALNLLLLVEYAQDKIQANTRPRE